MTRYRSLARRVAPWYGLAIVPVVAVLGVFSSTQPAVGLWPRFVMVAGPLALLGLAVVPATAAARERRPAVTWLLLAFGALLAWSLLRVPGATRTLTVPGTDAVDVPVPDGYVLVPLACAALALLVGALMAVATPTEIARPTLAWLAATVAAVSVAGLARALTDANPVTRLYTALGGAATTHLALLLALGVLLGLAWEEVRPPVTLLTAGMVAGLDVLTGSRAALGTLVLFLAVAGLRYLRAGRTVAPRLALAVAGVVVAAGALAAAVMRDQAVRLLSLGDESRTTNLATALAAWGSGPVEVVAGTGTGVLWPWYAAETGLVPVVGVGYVASPYGTLLTNPHSTYLGPLAELGLVGLGLVLTVVGIVVVAAWQASHHNPLRLVLLTAAAVGCVAFATDYYLLKSFPLALLWWYVVVLALRLPPPAARTTAEPPR